MMNSPCVVVAYLESKNPYYLDSREKYPWSNKKWRCLFVVTEDSITANKGYPFQSEAATDDVLDWLAKLAKANLGWEYDLGRCYTTMGAGIISRETGEVYSINRLEFECNFMYNDFYRISKHPCYVSKKAIKDDIEFINYSGEAQCMYCGRFISFDEKSGSADTLVCKHCKGDYCTCEECGCELEIDYDDIEWVDGVPYCEDCFSKIGYTCPFTSENYLKEDDEEEKTFLFITSRDYISYGERVLNTIKYSNVYRVRYAPHIDIPKYLKRCHVFDQEYYLYKNNNNKGEYLIVGRSRWMTSRCLRDYSEVLQESEKKELYLSFREDEFEQIA